MNKPAVSDNCINNIDNSDGAPFVDNIEEIVIVNDLAVKIFDRIKCRVIYEDFSAVIGDDKIPFYFHGRLRAEIKPYIIKILKNRSVYIPEKHILLLLRKLLGLYGIRANNYSSLSRFFELGSLSIREFFKRKMLLLANIWNRLWCYRMFESLEGNSPMIGVHISEGIDTEKKSDIHWFPKSQIEPDRVLLFINENSLVKKYGLFVRPNKHLLKELKASPFKWVFIPQKRPTGMYERVWVSEKIELPQWINSLTEKVSDGIDVWILNIFKELLYEIEFWKSFLRKFNVKMLYYPGEGSTSIIAQGIAFDVLGDRSGLTVGKQRSDIGHSVKVLAGYHTKDIVFTWNSRNPEYFRPPYNSVCSQIVAGHPNDANFLQEVIAIRNAELQFSNNKVKFTIALFDTGLSLHKDKRDEYWFPEMEMIYFNFLHWVMEDDSVGLLIKSKKTYTLNILHNILPLFKKVEQTGRCILVPVECHPAQVAHIADMAVGLNVSTAVSEAVIAGSKGIHYYSRFPKNHEYYKWGYEKLVFDDLNRMMKALKSYKADKSSNSELGDWTPYLDLLDPFRDGRAGERMGTYLRWCLEGFDAGLNRDDAIKQANNKYAAQWGDDKVINNHLKEH